MNCADISSIPPLGYTCNHGSCSNAKMHMNLFLVKCMPNAAGLVGLCLAVLVKQLQRCNSYVILLCVVGLTLG